MLLESQGAANVMRTRISALVASIIAFLATLSAGATAHPRHHRPVHRPRPVVPATYYEWANVAHCESNDNWEVLGEAYPDSLGITRANWLRAGGEPLAPASYEPLKVRYYEVKIADRFRAQYGGFAFPDQPYGHCTGSY